MSKTAIIYARYSSAQQGEGLSIERQIEKGKAFIESKGWTLGDILIDEGRSAYHGRNRAEGSALHKFELEAKQGLHKGKVLCVEETDRLSRQGSKAIAQLVWGLNEADVAVATWNDGLISGEDSDGLLNELMLIVRGKMDEAESDKKRERANATWKNRHKRIASGEKNVPIGKPPSWLKRGKEGYEVIEGRDALINELFDLYIAGYGFDAIAKRFNSRGETGWTASQRGWYQPYLHRLLTNRAVTGEYVNYQTNETVSQDFYPRVISLDKFNRAQAVLEGKKRSGGRDTLERRNILSGITFCGECRHTAGYVHKGRGHTVYKKKDGTESRYKRKEYQFLQCDNNRRRATCDNSAAFDYRVVETAILEKMLSATVNDNNPRLNMLDEQVADLTRRNEVLTQKISNLIDALAEGGSKALTKRLADYEVQQEAVERELAQVANKRAIEAARPSRSDQLAILDSLKGDLEHDDAATRTHARRQVNVALKHLDARVLLSADKTFSIVTDYGFWQYNAEGEYINGGAF